MKTQIKSRKETAVIYLISVALGFLITFVLMFGFAVISVLADLSDLFATPLASVSAAVGCLISAYFASRKLGSRGLVNGVVCGGVIFATTLLISLWIDDGGVTLNTLFNFIIMVFSAIIGGVWGVNRKQKQII